MATTLPPPKPELLSLPERRQNGHSGGGSRTLSARGWRSPRHATLFAPTSSSAIWVAIAAICMFFAAFHQRAHRPSGFINDWQHIIAPFRPVV